MKSLFCFLCCFAVFQAAAQPFEFDYTEDNGDKIGIINKSNGKLVVPHQFDRTEEFCGWMGMVIKGKKSGLYDLSRGKVYCCEYDEIEPFDDTDYPGMKGIVSTGGKMGLVGILRDNGKFETIIPLEYNSIEQHSDFPKFYILKKGSKYGIFNYEKRKLTVPCEMPKYPLIEGYGTFLVIYGGKNKSGLFNAEGKMILPQSYSSFEPTDSNSTVFDVSDGKKIGRYNTAISKFIIEPIEGDIVGDLILNQYYNMVLKKGKNWIDSYIDIKTGKPILSLDYTTYTTLINGHFVIIEKGKKFGIYDFRKNKIVIECKYSNEDEVVEKEKDLLSK